LYFLINGVGLIARQFLASTVINNRDKLITHKIMKNKVLALMIFMLTMKTLFAQEFQILPKQDAEWIVVEIKREDIPDADYTYDFCKYFINGDTLINEKTYHKLYCDDLKGNIELYGCIKIDEEKKQVIYRTNNKLLPEITCNDDKEVVLYDFSFDKIGDKIPYGCNGSLNETIIAIDTLTINQNQFKRYNLNGSPILGDYWIEFIGSTRGVLAPITDIPTCGCYLKQELVCFKYKGILYYKSENYTDCSNPIISAINEKKSDEVFRIFSNPANGVIYIHANKEIVRLELYSLSGQLINHYQQTGNVVSLNCRNGFYILKAITNDGISVSKKIFIN
jgi:hypothetical protein